ncbi:hypothetical protein HUA76_40975 [Myxococcus sp. CA056]|uniref:immunity protein Imm33 domain-containing protein n=1 Tax=Myxococcus sp. CA056 TaxID=2741740 RepID=UPI00157B0AEB|nr:hypothetical protein [Myxococcus sp. CA056]NTX17167.1 hypothetical protein [Myxococcus sp. CA056]
MTLNEAQQSICHRAGAEFSPIPAGTRVAIARNLRSGAMPIYGVRYSTQPGGVGWFFWAGEGELSTDVDYFQALHVEHLEEWCPLVLPYLALPPGWRFLTDGAVDDVWFDQAVLDRPIP